MPGLSTIIAIASTPTAGSARLGAIPRLRKHEKDRKGGSTNHHVAFLAAVVAAPTAASTASASRFGAIP